MSEQQKDGDRLMAAQRAFRAKKRGRVAPLGGRQVPLLRLPWERLLGPKRPEAMVGPDNGMLDKLAMSQAGRQLPK